MGGIVTQNIALARHNEDQRPRTLVILVATLLVAISCNSATPQPGSETDSSVRLEREFKVEEVLSDLWNPRGVGIDKDGALVVAEAGLGEDAEEHILRTGRVTRFFDRNSDGDFADDGEAERRLDHLISFNSVNKYETGRDEVSGASDVLVHTDGRTYFSLDGGIGDTGGNFTLIELDENGSLLREIPQDSNMTGIGFAPDQLSIYATQSTLNQLIEISLFGHPSKEIATFDRLTSGQQAVPAGLGVDPRTGDILVALFSGVARAEGLACRFVSAVMCDGRYLPLIPTDSKIVRVDPRTGESSDEITGLTAAVDVAVDSRGNVFTVEMAADHAQLFHQGADLFSSDIQTIHGGYLRYSGRVTMYPSDGRPERVLAAGLDEPTNITIGPDGALYVSTGQGTPGRPIPGPNGRTAIVGKIIRITGY